MKILMTGGTGHIGSRFIKKFPHHQYCVLTRSKSRAQECLPTDIQVIENLHSLDNLNKFDALINLAGEPIINKRWTAKQKQIICDSRYHITQQLVELFQKSEQPPKIFLSGSAIGIYSDVKENTVHELYTSPAHSFAAKLCMDWENIARKAEPFTRVVYLRTGIVLDKDAGALHKMLLPF